MAQAAEKRGVFTFEPFAQRPEYQVVTRHFVLRTLPFLAADRSTQKLIVGEVASGTGLATSEMAAILAGRPAIIVGVDNNRAALKIGREKVPSSQTTSVQFVKGDGKKLPLSDNSSDAFYFLNAIHEIPGRENKIDILREVFRALKPNAPLFVNSAFSREMFEGLDGTVWGKWKLKAMGRLGKTRDRAKRFEVLSTEEYCQMMEEAGFIVNREEIKMVPVALSAESLRAISQYDTFIEGVFMDMKDTASFTLEQKSQALIAAVDEMERDGVLTFSRNWVEITARKPA